MKLQVVTLNNAQYDLTNQNERLAYITQLLQNKKSKRTEYHDMVIEVTMSYIKFFADLKERLGQKLYKKAVSCLGYQKLEPEQVLFRAGDKGDKFYIILSGSVGIFIKLPSKANPSQHELVKVNEIRTGAAFGEIALMEDCNRTATIIAGANGAELAYMVKRDYQQILGQEQKMKLKLKIEYLKQYPFFKGNHSSAFRLAPSS